jgi:hypothetical protein
MSCPSEQPRTAGVGAVARREHRHDGSEIAHRLRNGALQSVLAARMVAEDLEDSDHAATGHRLVTILTDTARELRAIIDQEG